jgi:2-keto-4-pentenoate hydratase
MSPADIEQAASLLVEARRTHRAVHLPEQCRPHTLVDAYAIQERVTAELALPCAGFKVGATSARVAAAEGAESPVSGRLFEPHVHTAPVRLGADRFTSFRNCEVEFVARLDRTLTAREGGYDRAEIEAAVGAIMPAIEIGDSRLTDRTTAGILCICADNSGGTELVLGEPCASWRDVDLTAHAVSLLVDGTPVAHGTGAEVMGDPLASLHWLVGQRCELGESLAAGTLVATGSCTGINIAPPGSVVVADFGSLGTVEIAFER